MICWIDIETYSATPINRGTYRYTSDCEVMLVSYAFDDEPFNVWDVTAGKQLPGDLEMAIEDPDTIFTAHNAMFDRNGLRLGNLKLDIPIPRWRCTMAHAYAHSLPGSLDTLCEILSVPQDKAKQKDGGRLVQLFCVPQRDGRPRATRLTHPQEWEKFKDYCTHDGIAMRECYRRMPNWNYKGAELALWHLDQKINDRGVCVDVDLARAAITAVDRAQKGLAKATQQATGYDPATGKGVASATQRDVLLAHILEAYGVDLPDLQKATLERRIQDPDLPLELRSLLAIRLESTTTSTSKYRALINSHVDGRLRGLAQFCGAARTGRWAHRLFQPGNMPRPDMKKHEIAEAIIAIKAGCPDLFYPNVMRVCSNAIRGCIIAPSGKMLFVSDLSNIEGRGLAWLAGEEWKINAFGEYDKGTGPDLYKLAYSKSFRILPQDVDDDQRQVGKVQELALGYGGGVGAFLTFSLAYNLDLEEMGERAIEIIPADVLDEARGFLDWCREEKRPTFGLSDNAFLVCDSFKRMWRRAHPRTVDYWQALENTVRDAIEYPGNTFETHKHKIRVDGAWLRISLPSGRCLCYPNPKVDSGGISYMGINQYSRKWSRIRTYGGKLAENITQAMARDALAHGMVLAEDNDYEVVMTIHDELITERESGTAEELSRLMSVVPSWAPGLPLSAKGFSADRYRKD